MLTLLTSRSEIASTQRSLEETLFKQLPQRKGEYIIGYQGGNIKYSNFHADTKIWFVTKKIEGSRYWNAFGLADAVKISTSNSITVEINIPLAGANASIAGLFARSDDGSLHILHRGKIGGGRIGVGKQAFLEQNKLQLTPVRIPDGKIIEAVLVGKLGSPSLSADIARFADLVSKFKAIVSYQELSSLSNKDLENAISKAKCKPTSILIEATSFVRDPAVTEYVKRRANGYCDLCRKKAPFTDRQGKPYLECHHIQWLANGGSDTVDNACALCPNCHRKMHILNSLISPADIETLEKAASVRI